MNHAGDDRLMEPKPKFESAEAIDLKPFYGPEDLPDAREPGDDEPGAYPYTRGIHPTMYRGRLWTMRQYAGYGSAEDSNRRYHYLLRQGQTGLSVAFDLPTQMGYDSDHPAAAAEVGKAGVAIDSLADIEVLFKGIPLGEVTTSMTINATAAVLLAMYVAAAERQGVPPERLGGTTQNDILKEYLARGTYIFPPRPSLRLVTDLVAYGADRLPRWNPISVSGYHIREAGATASQEVAFTLADGITYVEAARSAGLDVDRVAPRLSFFFAAQMDLLEEVAKFRAARRLWAQLMRERYQARDPRSWMLRFHTQTAGVALTAQQPENNVVRVTIQALAAILGGTQSLHTNAMDEALALPTDEAALLALRTQQVIAQETGVADTVDPLGGAYFIEARTADIQAQATALIRQIEDAGGVLRALETGFIQRQIADAAYRESQRIERGEQIVVGVNRYQSEGATHLKLLQVAPEVVDRQRARLAQVRRDRHADAVDRALQALGRAAAGGDNLMPFILDAVRAYATVGEICDTLRTVFGVHRPTLIV